MIEVCHIKYQIDFIKEKFFKKHQCIMHSINSWKDTAHLQALAAIMAGKKPYYYLKQKSAAVNTYCGWIVCQRCKRACCCSRCADMIQKKKKTFRKIGFRCNLRTKRPLVVYGFRVFGSHSTRWPCFCDLHTSIHFSLLLTWM
jgi:hypothetical protein